MNDRFSTRWRSLLLSGFSFGNVSLHRDEAVRNYGYRIGATLDQELRKFGGSGGRPTEENNITDAIAAYDYLIERGVSPGKIVVYGESLGSGQAIRLAAARPVAAIILESPLSSTVDVARATYFGCRCAS